MNVDDVVGAVWYPKRRQVQSGGHLHGAGAGRRDGRHQDLREHQGRACAHRKRARGRRGDRAGRWSAPRRRQLRRHVGARRSRCKSASTCRCRPASISTSSPIRWRDASNLPVCATWITALTTRRTPASSWSAPSNRSRSPGALTESPRISAFGELPEDWEHLRTRSRRRHAPRARTGKGRHPQVFQRSRKLHRRSEVHPRAGAGTEELLRRRRLQLDRHTVGRRRRHSARALDRPRPAARSISGRSISAASSPIRTQELPNPACVGSARPPLRDALAVPPVRDVARGADIAAARSDCGARAPASAKWRARSGRTGSASRAIRRNTFTPMAGRTGSTLRAASTLRCARRVGLFDQSCFAKFTVTGPDAMRLLNRVSCNNVDVAPGNVVYTQWLNDMGGIEADLTVMRRGEDDFLVTIGGDASYMTADTSHGILILLNAFRSWMCRRISPCSA